MDVHHGRPERVSDPDQLVSLEHARRGELLEAVRPVFHRCAHAVRQPLRRAAGRRKTETRRK